MGPVLVNNELRREFSARGGIYPRSCPEGPAQMRAECLIEGMEPHIEVSVRFSRAIVRRLYDVAGDPVDELTVTGRRHTPGEDFEEHEVELFDLPNRTAEIGTAGSRRADLRERGEPAGTIVWGWEPLHATVEAWVDEIAPGLRRVRVEVANRLECDGTAAEHARLRTLHATHLLLHSPDGAFVSLAHPPAHLREESSACRNEGLWPTPIGEAGDRRTVLAAPVRLEDYPSVGDRQIHIAA